MDMILEDDREVYQPTAEDWEEAGHIFDAMERRREFCEAMARADVQDALGYCTVCGRFYDNCTCTYNPWFA